MLTSSACVDGRLKKELTLAKPITSGKSAGAKRVQEYLWVHDIKPVIDGDWGPATQAALNKFCKAQGVGNVTSVDQAMMDRLAQPLLEAVEAMAPKATLGASVVAFAKQQLAPHPIEIGGPNAGPWVRLYMDGNEGKDWLWCAGFATYIIAYCAKIHKLASPVLRTYSCDTLVARAQQAGRFHSMGDLNVIPPGSVFVIRSSESSQDWTHMGIVLQDLGTTIETAEGNTDHNGSSNGYEATSRIRNASKVDIITL